MAFPSLICLINSSSSLRTIAGGASIFAMPLTKIAASSKVITAESAPVVRHMTDMKRREKMEGLIGVCKLRVKSSERDSRRNLPEADACGIKNCLIIGLKLI